MRTHFPIALMMLAAFRMQPAQAAATLDVYTEYANQITGGHTVAGGLGYYVPTNPSLVTNIRTTTPYPNSPTDGKITHRSVYQSEGAVNKSRTTGCGGLTTGCLFTAEPDRSTAVASGYADPADRKVGGYTSATSTLPSPGALSTTKAKIATDFTLKAGTSGLQSGAEVQMNWNYHLEGSTHLFGQTWTDRTNALASVTSRAAIERILGVGSEEDPNLASVTFNLNLEMNSSQPTLNYPYSGTVLGSEQWSAYSNANFSRNRYELHNSTYTGSEADMSKAVYVDSRTGGFGLNYVPFKMKVGETVRLVLDLDLFTSVSGGANWAGSSHQGHARNNYFGTLSSPIELGDGFKNLGLQLTFADADAAAVPEPATAALIGLGFLAAGILRRNKA